MFIGTANLNIKPGNEKHQKNVAATDRDIWLGMSLGVTRRTARKPPGIEVAIVRRVYCGTGNYLFLPKPVLAERTPSEPQTAREPGEAVWSTSQSQDCQKRIVRLLGSSFPLKRFLTD